MSGTQEKIKSDFASFIMNWEENSRNIIWEENRQKFIFFWKNRILNKKSSDLTDKEIDEIVSILDKNGRGNTKEDASVAKAMIPQGRWKQLFIEFKNDKTLSKLINEIFTEQNIDLKGKLINRLYIRNEGKKNFLTGQSGNAINCFLGAFDPFNNLGIVSFKDRKMLMEFLKIPTEKYEVLSIGRKLSHSNSDIIQKFRSFGITNNARVLSDFVYSPSFKKQWKNIIIQEGEENTENNLEFALQKLNEVMKTVRPTKRKALVELTLRNDQRIVRLLKEATNYKCQFPNCIAEIRTVSGTNYVEVAHVEPVHKGGKSVLGNLIVLCPNHHKEFDYGVLHIDEQSELILTGTLNGRAFAINPKGI